MRTDSHRAIELDDQRKLKFQFRVSDSNQLHPKNGVAVRALERLLDRALCRLASHNECCVVVPGSLTQAIALSGGPHAGRGAR